jgi:hypothetical protein
MDVFKLLVPIITLLTAQIIIIDLSVLRFPPKKLCLILATELVIQLAINIPILIIGGLPLYTKWYILTINSPAIITYLYVSNRRDMRDLFTILITIFISFSITLPSIYIARLFGNSYLWYNISRLLLFSLIFLLLHTFVREKYIMFQNELQKGWAVYSILPAIGTIAFYYEAICYSRDKNMTRALIYCSFDFIIMTIVFALFLYVFTQLHEKHLLQEQQKILALQNKVQLEHFEHQREETEKINRYWHDLRHQTAELIYLIEKGDADIALDYLKKQRDTEN